jgi:hypothetical protein
LMQSRVFNSADFHFGRAHVVLRPQTESQTQTSRILGATTQNIGQKITQDNSKFIVSFGRTPAIIRSIGSDSPRCHH